MKFVSIFELVVYVKAVVSDNFFTNYTLLLRWLPNTKLHAMEGHY